MRRRTPDCIKERIVASSRHTVRSQPADVADGKVCIRSPAPVSNDRGCPGLLFEEVGFAVHSLPAKAGFEFAFPRPG